MQYTEAVEWMFKQFPSYQNIGKNAYKPDLGNIQALCDTLSIHLSKTKFVHIAGTNGKGSTTNMLASIFMEAGYKVGIFTSPHLLDFRERIAINERLITEEKVIQFCEKLISSNLKFSPSFFEITFAMALTHFTEGECVICFIETGLGGRLDATNLITPILSVITNISLDHTDLLGNTLGEIAFEKAGIIKKGVPVIIGEYHPETLTVFQKKAKETDSLIHFAFDNHNNESGISYTTINERTVKKTITQLKKLGFTITDQNISDGIKNLSINRNFTGRFQIIQDNPLVIIDVAHNEAGLAKTFGTIQEIKKGKLHIIYGTSSDKDLSRILPLFPFEANYYFTQFSSERSCTLSELQQKTTKSELNIDFFKNIEESIKSVKKSINEEDTLLITGSFFLISDFLKLFSEKYLQI